MSKTNKVAERIPQDLLPTVNRKSVLREATPELKAINPLPDQSNLEGPQNTDLGTVSDNELQHRYTQQSGFPHKFSNNSNQDAQCSQFRLNSINMP